MQAKKVFLSYARVDEAAATGLAKWLTAMGHEVWYDAELSVGQDWWDTILDRIEWCDVFVFGLSNASLDSVACQRERHYAQALLIEVLPVGLVTLDTLKAVPEGLARKQVELFDPQDPESVGAVNTALRALPGRPPMPDPAPPRPEVPLPPVAKLRKLVESTAPLNDAQQARLATELAHLIQQNDDPAAAVLLAQKMLQRSDVRLQTASVLRMALERFETAAGTQEVRDKRAPASAAPSRHWARRLVSGVDNARESIGVLVVLIALGGACAWFYAGLLERIGDGPPPRYVIAPWLFWITCPVGYMTTLIVSGVARTGEDNSEAVGTALGYFIVLMMAVCVYDLVVGGVRQALALMVWTLGLALPVFGAAYGIVVGFLVWAFRKRP